MRSITTIGIVLALLLLLFVGGCNSHNTFVDAETEVEKYWADVQAQYQRRTDLITNLVKTVKGAADFEKETLDAVVSARAKATSINIDASNVTPETLGQLESAHAQLNSSLGRLLATVERYPDLKSHANFRDLQTQLEGTENRVTVARLNYNTMVTGYNKKVRRFPASFFASIFGFEEKALFQAQAGAEQAPEVNFD